MIGLKKNLKTSDSPETELGLDRVRETECPESSCQIRKDVDCAVRYLANKGAAGGTI